MIVYSREQGQIGVKMLQIRGKARRILCSSFLGRCTAACLLAATGKARTRFFTSGKNRDRRMELSSYCIKSVSRNDLTETVSLVFFLVILRQFIKEFGKA